MSEGHSIRRLALRAVYRLVARGPALAIGGALAAASIVAGCAAGPVDRSEMAVRYVRALEARNYLRTDARALDAPYGSRELARNFERVVFQHEDQLAAGIEGYASQELRVVKWGGPIFYQLYGAGVRPEDRRTLAELARRLESYTGLPVRPAEGEKPNMRIFVMGPEERAAFLAHRRSVAPRAVTWSLESWVGEPSVPCSGVARLAKDAPVVQYAENYVSAEIDGALRTACFHEEFTQTLGLINDHPSVRPSLFNDDQEFAVLTEHDGDLLRLLYHPRLQPGMARAEAMPIVRRLAQKIRPRLRVSQK